MSHASAPLTSPPSRRPASLAELQPPHLSQACFASGGEVARQAITSAIRSGHAGRLPLFAATLGVDSDGLRELLRDDLRDLVPTLPDHVLADWLPAHFRELHALLEAQQQSQTPLAQWLSRAIAAACFGERHLWEELGLTGREALATLFATHYPVLHAANIKGMRWKRFLFDRLGEQLHIPGLRPPGCTACAIRDTCLSD